MSDGVEFERLRAVRRAADLVVYRPTPALLLGALPDGGASVDRAGRLIGSARIRRARLLLLLLGSAGGPRRALPRVSGGGRVPADG